MSDDPTDNQSGDEDMPRVFASVKTEEIKYLQSYWEIRDTGELFAWAWRLFCDLTKADEKGWIIILQKAEIDEASGTVTPDSNYRAASFRVKWMIPEKEGFFRLPIDDLETLLKRKPSKEDEE